MKSLGLLVVLAAAAVALPTDSRPEEKEDKVFYRCNLENKFNLYIKDLRHPFYYCTTDSGDGFRLATDTFKEDNVQVYVDRDTNQRLRETRPKRQYGQGYGGSSARSQASSNSFGLGGGLGLFGIPLVGIGGGFSNAQSSAYSSAGGGGLGGNYYGG